MMGSKEFGTGIKMGQFTQFLTFLFDRFLKLFEPFLKYVHGDYCGI